jgi:2-keto-4-pentenoate hydratase/2-oxohepta-3-ene-1,7-dioic acid hydratase in catechol pathway
VIGTKAQYVSESKALDYVAGYAVVNDVSERFFQMGPGGQWDRGKGCDTFGPVGPWLVTTDEITDPAGARPVARRERREAPARQHAHHDLQLRAAGLVREPVHDAAAGRHHHHRHAAGVASA